MPLDLSHQPDLELALRIVRAANLITREVELALDPPPRRRPLEVLPRGAGTRRSKPRWNLTVVSTEEKPRS